MKLLKKQRGMTFFALMIILALIAFFTMLILKVTPLYMEFSSVKEVMNSVAESPDLGKKAKKYIRDAIDKGLYINDVSTINGRSLTYVKEKKRKVWTITADYEARADLFGNVSVVAKFNHVVELPR